MQSFYRPLVVLLAFAIPAFGSERATPPDVKTTDSPLTGSDRAAWMREAKFGVMTHYLADWIARRDEPRIAMTVERWNELVDRFDVDALTAQLESVGARYLIFTIGQNSGYYASPNAAYDAAVGRDPSRCSRRDLIADLAAALERRHIRLIAYLPSGAPSRDAVARERLRWTSGPHANREFQEQWEAVIREWSTRWGPAVAGWWFDGCYWPNAMYRGDHRPNFASFAAAARAGNPHAAVAFNPGVVYRTLSVSPHEDYVAGEVDDPARQLIRRATGGLADGATLHQLSYLGTTWGTPPARFTADQAVALSLPMLKAGGCVTWDVPIQSDGTIRSEFLERLAALSKAVVELPPTTKPTAAPTAGRADAPAPAR
jgi:hypothetical protein